MISVTCPSSWVSSPPERMTAGQEVEKRFRPAASRGRPWFAVIDAKGRALATSDGPEGNVGFPVEPGEIAHFMDVLKETARRMSADDLAKVEQALKDNAAKIKGARSESHRDHRATEEP